MKRFFTLVSNFLSKGGHKAIEKGADNKYTLSEDQANAIKAGFGEKFLEKFKAHLNDGESDDNQDIASEMVAAMTAHNQEVQAQFSAQLSQAQQQFTQQLTAAQQQITTLQDQVTSLSESPEQDPLPEISSEIPRKEGVKTVLRVDMRKPHYAAVGQFLKDGYVSPGAAKTIEVDDLKTEFGTYLSQGKHNLDWVETVRNGFTSSKYFTTVMATTEYRGLQALITSVMQQFSSVWTPAGKTKFRPLVVKNYRHKINVPIKPAEVLDSYMLHLYDEGLAPDQMPITNYIINSEIMPQILQDVEVRMIFKGKYVDHGEPEENSPGTPPEDSMDGLETVVNDGKDGRYNINYFEEGNEFNWFDPNTTDEEILEFMANFTSWIAPLFRIMKMPILCGDEVYKRYKRAYKNVWGSGNDKSDSAEFGSDMIDYSRQYLAVADGMYGSQQLIVTPPKNLVKLRHKNELPRLINDVQLFNYVAKVFGECWLSVGFKYGEGVFASAPNDYDPKALVKSVHGPHTQYQQFQLGDSSASGSAGGGI